MLYTDEKEHAITLYNDNTRAIASINNTKSTGKMNLFGMLGVKDSTVRYAGLIIVFWLAIAEFILGVMAAANARVESPPLYISLAFSILTIAAVIVLAAYNNQPTSTHVLSKLWVHVVVLVVLAHVWFPLTVLLTIHAVLSCRYGHMFYPGQRGYRRWDQQTCDLPIAGSVFAYIMCAIVMTLAMFVALRGQKLGFKANVADADAMGPIHLDREEGEDVERQGLLAMADDETSLSYELNRRGDLQECIIHFGRVEISSFSKARKRKIFSENEYVRIHLENE
ncbi:hypothetical protein EUX98_g6053 [Antrodiella citrinella]|uniref:Uncharacterized protein n=1 Tax=Antrodiella citrinella TaxID=2447956 RepID=A0A4S4MPY3_9APHY|nr:hypothetical protein EUX98_g6053 [Antrodiella citrinella]